MENITIGEIAVAVALIVGLITGLAFLVKQVKSFLANMFKEEFDTLNKKMDNLQTRIDDVDMASCKNYLVYFLSNVDQGQQIDEIEKERFWEQYQHYEKIGGNSYIKRKVEQLKAEGKL